MADFSPFLPLRRDFPTRRAAPLIFFLVAGLILVLSTALANIGIIAMDDYTDVIARIVPAGVVPPDQLVAASGIRSPVPSLVLAALAQTAKKLSIDSPANQLRFVLAILGAWSFLAACYSILVVFKTTSRAAIAIFLVGFYFLSPLALTRPMFESLCTPYLILSAGFATSYWRSNKKSSLLLALLFLTLASLFRFQAGLCLPVLILLPLIARRPAHLIPLGIAMVGAFLLTGFIDLGLRGQFHSSLRAYVQYNLSYSSTYGVTPFYTFFLLFLGLSIPPLLVSRYRGLEWRNEYAPLVPVLLYFLFFVGGHSLVPHKEERFVIPALPLFLMLVVPLANYFWKTKAKWRIGTFLVLNGTLLVLTSYNTAQNNVVGLGIFLDKHVEINRVRSVGQTLVIAPTAYVGRSLHWEPFEPKGAAVSAKAGSCDSVVVCRSDLTPLGIEEKFTRIESFKPGVLEALLIKLNPRQNSRRGTIELYLPKDCPRS